MRCGVGDYTANLARAIAEDGKVELQVLTSQISMPQESDPPWVLRQMPSWGIGGTRCFLNVLRDLLPDIVHVQYPTQGYQIATAPGLLILLARLRQSVPVIATWHEFPPPSFNRGALCMYALAALAHAIVVVRPGYHVRGTLASFVGQAPIYHIANASVIPRASLSDAERNNLRSTLKCGDRQLVSFFGFAYPHKGVDQLFELADPARHQIVIIGELSPNDAYHRRLLALIASDRWKDRVTVTGFVEPETVARILAVSDASVFPFVEGGGTWNSSLHAAMAQGTFVITTSRSDRGFVPEHNIYYALPGAIDEMRIALAEHAGRRRAVDIREPHDPWRKIAAEHVEIYRAVLRKT